MRAWVLTACVLLGLGGCGARQSSRASAMQHAMVAMEHAIDASIDAIEAASRGRALRVALRHEVVSTAVSADITRVAAALRAHERMLAPLRAGWDVLADDHGREQASAVLTRAGDALLAARAAWRVDREPEAGLIVTGVLVGVEQRATRARAERAIAQLTREAVALLEALDPGVLAAEELVTSEQRATLRAASEAGLVRGRWPPGALGLGDDAGQIVAWRESERDAPEIQRAQVAAWDEWVACESGRRLRRWREALEELRRGVGALQEPG